LDNHEEMAKALDVSGTYVKYFGRKNDVQVIQGLLFDARRCWKRLTVRTHERGRHLQQAYRKSKQVICCSERTLTLIYVKKLTSLQLCVRTMKKALDYVSDYQLKSACKDAICMAPSKVTQMIFAVLED